jgi:hypothetical protein
VNLFVQGVGLVGPGLDDWSSARPVLAAEEPHHVRPTVKPVPALLPATERRRSSDAARLAIQAATEAFTMAGMPGQALSTIFVSSDGDGDITHRICEALAKPDRAVSPTSFHNSVYNAPAGYWSIATGSHCGSTTLCAFDTSCAAGLLEAAVFATVERLPVLLVVYDLTKPEPLHATRPVSHSFAAAFLFSPSLVGSTLMRWHVSLTPRRPPTAFPSGIDSSLEDNPAARCLPLLCALATQTSQRITLNYFDEHSLEVVCEQVAHA